jgi:hypothetical protein
MGAPNVTTSDVSQNDNGSSECGSPPNAAIDDVGEDAEALEGLRFFAAADFAFNPFALLLGVLFEGGGAMASSSNAVNSA